MRWHVQLKSETCFLKKVICFKFGKNVSKMRYNTRQRQQRASETEDEKKTKRNEKDRERRAQRLLQKKTMHDEDGEVQYLAVPKRIKKTAESDEPIYPLRVSLALKFSILLYQNLIIFFNTP